MNAILELAVWLKLALALVGLVFLAFAAIVAIVAYVIWDMATYAWRHRRR